MRRWRVGEADKKVKRTRAGSGRGGGGGRGRAAVAVKGQGSSFIAPAVRCIRVGWDWG